MDSTELINKQIASLVMPWYEAIKNPRVFTKKSVGRLIANLSSN